MKSLYTRLSCFLLLALYAKNYALSQDATYKISVSYGSNVMPVKDKYVIELNGVERMILDTAHKSVSFSKEFRPGESYRIRLINSPRPANFLNAAGAVDSVASGTITNSDIPVVLKCPVPLTIIKMNIIGIEQGEVFKFADNYGRTSTVSFSLLHNQGGFPVGDPLIIKQISGPRPCVFTPPNGRPVPSSPNNPVTIQCDCRKPAAPPPPPANKYDLITRSTDNKTLNSYYESWTPVVGGKGEDEGRYVAFGMYGKGIDGSTGNYRQIFWRDRKLGITKLVSRNEAGNEGDGNSAVPSISADGQSVAFESYAKNLCDGDMNGARDVFVWNNTTNTVILVSKGMAGGTANYESSEPVISGDGTIIAYTSNANDLVDLGKIYTTPNVYVHHVNSGSTTFITKDYEKGTPAGGYSPSISEDGNKIAFCAFTNRLTANDNNNLWDIFLWQRGQQGLKRISKTANGTERNQGTESSSRVVFPVLSGNGEYIVYPTTSSNIVEGDKNELQDIFLYHINTSSVKRISTLNNITEGDGDSPISQGEKVGISYDGNWITYNTNATNLGVPKGNIVLQNTETGKIVPITNITHGSTARPMLSRHGNYVVAGCSEQYDNRFASSGIFAIYTNIGACKNCND